MNADARDGAGTEWSEPHRSRAEAAVADAAVVAAARDAEAGEPDLLEELVWLALPPSWTDESATVATFPVADLTSFISRSISAGWAERRGGGKLDGSGRVTFWARSTVRRQLIEQAVRQRSQESVLRIARTIAQRLDQHADWWTPLPRTVRNWIDLVPGHERAEGGSWHSGQLLRRVQEHVGDDRLDRAVELISAAEALAPLVGQPLTDQIRRAHRMLHLGYRRRQDERALVSFVRREEQLTAVTDLLGDEDDERWALHILGQGGTGKTMLARYLSCGLFAEQRLGRRPFPVARIDFDHISPNYPVRQPVQLLVELADALSPYARNGEQDRALSAFRRIADSAHAATVDLPDPTVRDGLRDEAVAAFARLIRELEQPVLLVLDTCEELAKVYPAITEAPPPVRETFNLLEQVHAAAPAVRVLLAGRRPMTRGAFDRKVPPAIRDSPLLLSPRPYLRVHEVRGFSEAEARTLLATAQPEPVPERLVPKLLGMSPDTGPVLMREGEDGERYNPFWLNEFVRWWESDPTMGDEWLDRGNLDAYVQTRIVDRIGPDRLRRLVPSLALLGRFDQRMIAPVLEGLSAEAVSQILTELADLEWIAISSDPLSGSQVLEVAEPLQRQLLAWAGRPERAGTLAQVRHVLARSLAAQLAEVDLEELTADHVVAAVRLSIMDAADDPDVTRELWQTVERRVAIADRWDWVDNVIPRVLGELEAANDPDRQPPDPVLLAQLQATTIALRRRASPMDRYETMWQGVRAVVDAAPAGTGTVVRRLGLRAELGVAATRQRESTDDELWRLATAIDDAGTDRSLAGSVVAAIDGVMEHTPASRLTAADGPGYRLIEQIAGWQDVTDDHAIRAALRVLARRLRQSATGERAVGSLSAPAQGAARAARQAAEQPGAGRWADWIGPRDCLAWVLLHEARDAYLSGQHLADLSIRMWEETAASQIRTIDGERLMSQCLQLRLGFGVVRRETLDRLWRLDAYDPHRQSRGAIHQAVPPLFVSIAEAYLALGDADRAVRVIRERRAEARGQRREDVTLLQADRALTEVARRLRGTAFELATNVRLAQKDPRDRPRVWAARALVDGLPPVEWLDRELSAEDWHHCWSAQQVNPRTAHLKVPTPVWLRAQPAPDGMLLRLLRRDAQEVVEVGTGDGARRLRRWSAAGPDRPPERAVRWDERSVGYRLATAEDGAVRDIERDSPAMPPLVVARLALEIGELRALRVPARSIELLKFAARRAEASPVLAMQATTLHALALVHAGQVDPDAARGTGLAAAYRRFHAHVHRHAEPARSAQVPPWEKVIQRDTVFEGPWQGWLDRIRLASLAIADRRPPAWNERSVELFPGPFGQDTTPADEPDTPGPTALHPIALHPTAMHPTAMHSTALPGPTTPLSVLRWVARPAVMLSAVVSPAGQRTVVMVSYEPTPPTWNRGALNQVRRAIGQTLWPAPFVRGVLRPAELELPEQFLGPLQAPARLKRSAPLPGRLTIAAEQQGELWEEAMYGASRPRSAGTAILWYRHWPPPDSMLGSPRRAGRHPGWSPRTLRVYLPSQTTALVEPAATGLDVVQVPDGASTGPPGAASTVLLIGRPVFTTAGVLYQVSDRRAIRAGTEEVLVAPDDFGANSARLVVLLGAPYDSGLHLDPFETRNALRFAIDTMVAGAAAVLVLPALPVPAAEQVLRLVAGIAAGTAAPGPAELVGLAARARDAIAASVRGEAPDEVTAAQDQVRLLMTEEGIRE